MPLPLPLFQYWHKPNPPSEIIELMQSWSSDSAYRYQVYHRRTARRYIARHYDFKVYSAFNQCKIPAMESDLFRYCKLYREGGLYIDSDINNIGGLSDFIVESDRCVVMRRRKNIANDVLFFPKGKNPVLGKVLNIAVDNIENRISNDVWQVTGPGIMTKMYRQDSSALTDFRIEDIQDMQKVVAFPSGLKYKAGRKDWRKFRTNNVSIFRTPRSNEVFQWLKFLSAKLG